MPSYLRLYMTSNKDWVVKASETSRRWAVFDASNRHRGDHAWFDAILAEKKNGGLGALLHHLQTIDLTGFDVRKFPITEALADQKILSLDGHLAWWHEHLASGEVPGVSQEFKDMNAEPWEEVGKWVSTENLHNSYSQWMREHRGFGKGEPLSKEYLGRELVKIAPRLSRRQKPRGGLYHYYLAPLPELRKAFADAINVPVQWRAGDPPTVQDGEELI